MKKKLIFDRNGDDRPEAVRILNGKPTSLLKLVDVKYHWALALYKKMLEHFWIPEKVNLSQDITDYSNLLPNEKKAFKGILSFLIFLDSIQTTNLPRISDFITASEINLALSVQSFQEAIHSQSYGYLIESLIPKDEVDSIYDFWRDDNILLERISYIADKYQAFSDRPTKENFIITLISNYILEGIYFYTGFNFFYLLAYTHRMQATSQVFAYINRDELTHVVLFQRIIREVINVNDYKNVIYTMVDEAVNYEIKWGNHILGDQILGFNEYTIDQYVKFIANDRLRRLGLLGLYTEQKYTINPFKHLENISNVMSGSSVRANFFETTVTDYGTYNGIKGWAKV